MFPFGPSRFRKSLRRPSRLGVFALNKPSPDDSRPLPATRYSLLTASASSQVGQEGAEFGFRVFVRLVDGELQRRLQVGAGLLLATERQQAFAEQDPWHHPIGFAFDAVLILGDRLLAAAGGFQCLRQTEAEQLICRLLRHQTLKMLNAFGRAHEASTDTSTAVMLSAPPARLARSTIWASRSIKESGFRSTSASSASSSMRVTPSVAKR